MSSSTQFFGRNAFSLAACVFVLCDYSAALDDEVNLIWRGPMNWVKGMYLTVRYSVLITSIANMVYLFWGPLRYHPNVINDCRRWFALFASLPCIPIFAIDGLSMIRTYVLYQRNLRIGALAASLIFTEAILFVISTFKGNGHSINMSHHVLVYGVWVAMTQLALIGLTLHKLKSISGRLDASTVHLVLYQGMGLCFFVVVLLFATLLHSILTGTANANVVAIWPTSLSSTVLCRVILSLRRDSSRQDETLDDRTDLEEHFTSWFSSPGEGVHDVRSRDGNSELRRRTRSSVHSHNSAFRLSSIRNSNSQRDTYLGRKDIIIAR
ncbi:hypothetical protein BKA70DRAFT_1345483 [Coprinopsis sp. MPI-PUGE-AT-0042]|nr:hypothetical protein BKA70DRAFT_1345483 [Coprinopsis sp. MPI-PUGE-AT-0042]